MLNARELLRRNLSPRAYRSLQHYRWLGSFYVPRRVAAAFAPPHAPRVHTFDAGSPSDFIRSLRGINVLAPTHLCRVMTRYGSDKGQGHHNYTTVYAALFAKTRFRALRIFELGLGTNNPTLVSTMGTLGRPGASLRGWREFFPNALIYGADVDPDILFEEDRIKTYYCDQTDEAAIRNLWMQPGLGTGGMDIIIDDGLHTFEGNISFLEGSLRYLRPGGFYVVEDIVQGTIGRWLDVVNAVYSRQFPDHEFALVELPNPCNDRDNNLLIVRKRP